MATFVEQAIEPCVLAPEKCLVLFDPDCGETLDKLVLNRVIDLRTLEENMSKVKNYCSDDKNFKVPVMKAVEQVLGKTMLLRVYAASKYSS
jgi:hypothetical protein